MNEFEAFFKELNAPVAALPCGHFRSVRFAIHDVRFEQCLTCAMVSTVEVPCAV